LARHRSMTSFRRRRNEKKVTVVTRVRELVMAEEVETVWRAILAENEDPVESKGKKKRKKGLGEGVQETGRRVDLTSKQQHYLGRNQRKMETGGRRRSQRRAGSLKAEKEGENRTGTIRHSFLSIS